MAVVGLTEARVRDLPLGSGIWRDEQVKGLLVVCHKNAKTYAVQGDVRRNGRFIRTVRMKIERCDRIGLREARMRAKTLMVQIQSGVDPSASPEETAITLGQLLERYIEARDLAAATVVGYRYHVDHYLKRWKNRAIADITRGEVRDLYDELKQKSGNTTANLIMRTLRALINEARRIDESITANPVSAIRVPQNKRREVPELNLAEWWTIIQGVRSPIRRDLHIFFLFCGLRRLSAITIRREDVNLEKGIIRVRHMKSGRPFILPLSDFLVELLRKRMEEDEPLNSPWLWPSIGSRSGHIEEPWEPKVPSPHVYRHLWRTHAIGAGVPYAESALLLDQRLPGASGGYVHPEHLVEQMRPHQQAVTNRLLLLLHKAGK